MLLAQTLQNPARQPTLAPHEWDNVRNLDQYDGLDLTKLQLFFTQLELVFKVQPRTFDSDKKKVTYTISYLKGTSLQWFEPYLLEGETANPPIFLMNYEEFQQELRVNFGPYDATGQAKHDLENLWMADNQRITKHIMNFSHLATQVCWGTSALRYQFYKGLPTRLKDQISEVGKPATLEELQNLMQSLDHCYWECKTEQSRETSGTHKSSPKSGSEPKSSGSQQSKSSDSSAPKASSAGSSKPSASLTASQTSGKSPTKSLSDKLGKDRKLTQEERQRCFANNLCLFCGGPGHTTANCPKKTSSTTKACAAQATPAEPKEAPKESKN